MIKENKTQKSRDPLFKVIYADPPWKYDFTLSKWKKLTDHYNVMELDDIKNYPIPKCKNAVLFLWATAPLLPEALEVMKAWGFKYKSCAVWDKVRKDGMGFWFRGQHELLLVGKKGDVSVPKNSIIINSVYQEKKKKHSQKPAYFRRMIDKYFPDAEKIELFARTKGEGWKTEGNEKIASVHDWIK